MPKKYIAKKGGKYWPSKEMKKISWVKDSKIYKVAEKNPKKFWAELAKQSIDWERPWEKIYEEKLPYFKWFKRGKLNFCHNCIDRWVEEKGDKIALIWIPEPVNEKPIKITYRQLFNEVNKFANVLKKQGVRKGDIVAVYMPMIPEAAIAMLACTRIGAVHSVVFSAFSADALKDRIQNAKSKVLITADGYYRRGKPEDLIKKAKSAIKRTTIKKVIVIPRLGKKIKGRKFLNFSKEIKKAKDYCKPEIMNSEDNMFILYSSGTTGKPKGIVHDTGGYAVQAYTTCKWNFNLHDDDVMWCVPPNTPIITNFGTKEISSIKQDEYILSHNGKFTKVLRIFQRDYQGDIIKLKLHYFNEPILITPNHKIWASKNKKGPFEWIPASEIKKGYYLLFPKIKGIRGYKRKIQISDIINYKKWKYKIKEGKIFSSKEKHKIKNRIEISEELMRLFGYYCAEGSMDRDAIYFNFGKHEKEYIDDTKNLLLNVFSVDAKIKDSNPHVSPVCVSSTILSKLFEKLFGKYAHEKKLPDWFIFLPNRLLKEFVKGFWRGDGNFSNVGFEFVTTSKILSNQIRMILIKLEIIPSINIRKIDGKKDRYSRRRKFSYKNNLYRITITGSSIEKMSKILEVDHPFIHQRSKTFSRGKITKNFLWMPVVSVNKEKYNGKVFNLKTEAETYTLSGFAVHNCTADVGWITGHTYAIYGPLLNGSTSLIYEGSPDFPDFGRWWKIIQDNKVTVFYTAPTAIRMFMKSGDKYIKKYNLDSLKILGTVGEPIDEDAWDWYLKQIGGNRCPIIDTWWQTETGGALINVLPGIGPFVPTVAGRCFPGTKHIIVDDKGKEIKAGKSGFLVQKSPFAPGMLHGVYKNPNKYVETYWRFKKYYDTSDGAYIKNGLIRVTGRTDDVMKVAGHRLSTAELENAISSNKKVRECAVVPIPDKIKGEAPIAFVVLKHGTGSEKFEKMLKKHVDKKIGPTARPSKIYFVDDLPKTRSGKIMRRILKALLVNEEPKGLMTLVNPDVVEVIRRVVEEK